MAESLFHYKTPCIQRSRVVLNDVLFDLTFDALVHVPPSPRDYPGTINLQFFDVASSQIQNLQFVRKLNEGTWGAIVEYSRSASGAALSNVVLKFAKNSVVSGVEVDTSEVKALKALTDNTKQSMQPMRMVFPKRLQKCHALSYQSALSPCRALITALRRSK